MLRHRRRLGLSQRALAARTFDLSIADPELAAVSERTIQALEQGGVGQRPPRTPRLATVRTLARAFGLESGSLAHDAFCAVATGEDAPSHPDGVSQSPIAHAGEELGFVVAGREPHLDRLLDAIDAAAAGDAGVVLVGADPGTGKTWLIEEACRRALAQHPELVVLWTECTDRFGTSLCHEPFRRMLSLMVGDLAVASDRERITDRNVDAIASRVPAAILALSEGAASLIDRLVPVGAIDNDLLSRLDDEEVRRRLDRAIQQRLATEPSRADPTAAIFHVLTAYAEAGPVVLVVEDLHWADPGTISTLAHLTTRLAHRRMPVLVLGSYRPGEVGASGADPSGSLETVLHIAPRLFPDTLLDLSTSVGGEAGRAFVDAMVAQAGLPEASDLAASLFERTAGLPLFVVGVLRLHDQDRRQVNVSENSLPAEAEVVFAEQLHRLPASVRTLLTAASVQGTEFAAEPLMRMLDLTPTELIDMVDSRLLRQFRMLRPGRTVTIAGLTVHHYQFSHALLRDYLVSSMSAFQREHYHAVTAEAMLELYGSGSHEAWEAIAFHFRQAGRKREAAGAYRCAGDHAMERRDLDRALDHYRCLEELGDSVSDPELSLHGIIGQGNVMRAVGDAEQARALLDRAHELTRIHHQSVVRTHVMESLAMLDLDAGDMKAGVDRLTGVVEAKLATGHSDTDRSMANLSYLLYGMGRYETALSYAQRAEAMATQREDERALANAVLAIGNCWLDLGLYERAIVTYDRCVSVCERLGARHLEQLCRLNIALAHGDMGRWRAASEAIERAGVTVNDRAIRLIGMSEYGRGLVAEGRGDLVAARHHYR
ncbi:MAG TPA: AAA family ATPase, partial [Thermomicrobiales bacterium]|nr:AAA family ATPase [Thermomicrobiales bacterium]